MRARGKGSSSGRVNGSSRVMLATARPSCYFLGVVDMHSHLCHFLRFSVPKLFLKIDSFSTALFNKYWRGVGFLWTTVYNTVAGRIPDTVGLLIHQSFVEERVRLVTANLQAHLARRRHIVNSLCRYIFM